MSVPTPWRRKSKSPPCTFHRSARSPQPGSLPFRGRHYARVIVLRHAVRVTKAHNLPVDAGFDPGLRPRQFIVSCVASTRVSRQWVRVCAPISTPRPPSPAVPPRSRARSPRHCASGHANRKRSYRDSNKRPFLCIRKIDGMIDECLPCLAAFHDVVEPPASLAPPGSPRLLRRDQHRWIPPARAPVPRGPATTTLAVHESGAREERGGRPPPSGPARRDHENPGIHRPR
jgi:hypothetical protein